MAFIAAKGITQLGIDDSKLQQGIGRVQGSLRGLQTRMRGVSRAARNFLIVGAAAVGGLVKLASDQEKAERELTAALEGTGQATDANIARLKAFATSIQRVTTFGDETILSITALGLNMGIAADQVGAAVKASIGLSKAFRIDLQASMILVARANKGQTETLTRYGIQLDKTGTKQEQFAELLRLGADKFALAEAEADTFRGQLKQLGDNIGDLGQAIGKAFLPKLTEMVTKMKEATPLIEQWALQNQALIATTAGVTLGTAGVAFGLSKLIEVIAEITIAGFGLKIAFGAIVAPLAGITLSGAVAFAVVSTAILAFAGNIALTGDRIDILINKIGKLLRLLPGLEKFGIALAPGELSEREKKITQEQQQIRKDIAKKEQEIADETGGVVAVQKLIIELLALQVKEQDLFLERLKLTKESWTDMDGSIAQVDSRIGKAKRGVEELNAELENQKRILEEITAEIAAGVLAAERQKKIADRQASLQKRIAQIRITTLREQNTFESKRLALLETERLKLEEINKLQRDAVKDLGTPLTALFEELRQKTVELFQARLRRLVPDIEARAVPRPQFVGLAELSRQISTAGVAKEETQQRKNQFLLEQSLRMEQEIRDNTKQTVIGIAKLVEADTAPPVAVVGGPG